MLHAYAAIAHNLPLGIINLSGRRWNAADFGLGEWFAKINTDAASGVQNNQGAAMSISSLTGPPPGGPSPDQIKALQQTFFKAADADGDQSLSLDEFTNARRPDGAGGPQGAQGPSAAEKAKVFKSLDKDGDGSLSLAEFQAGKPPPPPGGPKLDSASLSTLIDAQAASTNTAETDLATALINSLYDQTSKDNDKVKPKPDATSKVNIAA